jgi:hypothetical protein
LKADIKTDRLLLGKWTIAQDQDVYSWHMRIELGIQVFFGTWKEKTGSRPESYSNPQL